jgi:basic membrane lipoprotein Med (substrate-binding protein (PBP1-ABC) superfamily)
MLRLLPGSAPQSSWVLEVVMTDKKFHVAPRFAAQLALVALTLGTLFGVVVRAAADEIKIGIIMEARPAEQPWSAAIYDAAQALAKKNPSLKFLQSYKAYDPTSAEPVARQMLQEGAVILDMHSFALNDVAHALAKEFPKIPMSVSSFDPPVQPNLNIGTVSYLQVGYSNCWLLAKLSKSGKIAFVGALPIPYATEALKGCELGAAAANSGTKVLAGYGNSFSNPQTTREVAQGLLDQGADVLFPASATEDSLGGFQLCEQKQIPCAGWVSDVRRYAPNYGVVSAIANWTIFLEGLIAQHTSGKLEANTFDASFGNGGLTPQPFEGAPGKLVPADVQKGYADVIKALTEGKIELPKSQAHPCCT